MVRKQISLWVDEDILRAFDEWCWNRRLPRTKALVEYMAGMAETQAAVSSVVTAAETLVEFSHEASSRTVPAETLQEKAKLPAVLPSSVVDEIKAGLEREQVACPHPKAKIRKTTYGVHQCGECNATLS